MLGAEKMLFKFKVTKKFKKFKPDDILVISDKAKIRHNDYIIILTEEGHRICKFNNKTPQGAIIGKIIKLLRDF